MNTLWHCEALTKKKIVLVVLFLFCLVLMVFCISCQSWIFSIEDYVGLLRVKLVENFGDFIEFFTAGSMESDTTYVSISSSVVKGSNTFFNIYYRPFVLITYMIENYFFGMNPYLYFMFTIALHAGIVSLFFYKE